MTSLGPRNVHPIHFMQYFLAAAGIHLLKVSYRNTKARCEICPKCLYC